MKFSCKKCRTQYSIADEKVRGKVIKVRCKRCQQLIIVREPDDGPAAEPAADDGGMLQDASLELEFEHAFRDLYRSGIEKSPATPSAPAAPSMPPLASPGLESVWFYGLDGSEEGPFTLVEMEEHLRQGRLTPDHFAWRDGMEDWKPLSEVPELAQLLPRDGGAARAEARRRAVEAEREEAFRARLQARRKTAPPAPEPPPVEVLKEKKLKEEAQRQDRERKQAEEKKKEEERRRKEERSQEERRRKEEQRLAEEARRREEEERRRREEEDERKREAAKKEEERRCEAERRAEEARRREAEERERRRKKDESRIAEHFFSRGELAAEADAPLPPPPVMDAEEAARELQQQSLAEEEAALPGEVPRVSENGPMPGEISDVIVRQAGVASGGRRMGVALLLIFGILGLAGGMLALAFSQGWFSPPSTARTSAPSTGHSSAGDVEPLSEEEARKLRAQIWDVKHPARANPASTGSSGGRTTTSNALPSPAPVLSEREKELLAFYQQQDQNRSEATPRVPAAGLIGPAALTPDLPTSTPISPETGKLPGKGPEARPEAPAPATPSQRLSEDQIRSVIQLHYRQVKNCLERQLKRDASLTGMLQVVARVQPDGSVQSASIATPRFQGSVLETCLVKTVRRWRFPAFAGEAYEVTFPLLLSAQQDY